MSDWIAEFIGYPIWWCGAAWPANHFVTDHDFIGKESFYSPLLHHHR
ncbi:hypothetical protein GT751_00090 [Bifidobacterium pseudocatenulatum]|uniref:Uncharacterized protein n=1 Tax=Bifidobacterium pseudocatenulatum TaxID=28026 RepID=A0AAW4TZS3_BIFPS|nr:hypothetical protein [Bifidobacterium pseudocatenulatum]MCB4864575.1 hypothetical protein [Bifidobacterium pseudocatenulatum]MCB4880360.1 hypothetical protein [Bifidobacterium pseudocatenulatum]MCG4629746.1 hypothetical protein [Bifidobacterium pseudocatenulatum]MZN99562.1 hypothetical protein [Bifidobacterium pseudocatenulatum]MZO06593.1 hypothetical protein [Bifidobacterium pseudocatenulatum]